MVWAHLGNIMDIDAMAPCVARLLAAMAMSTACAILVPKAIANVDSSVKVTKLAWQVLYAKIPDRLAAT